MGAGREKEQLRGYRINTAKPLSLRSSGLLRELCSESSVSLILRRVKKKRFDSFYAVT